MLVTIKTGVGVICDNSLGKKVSVGLTEPHTWYYGVNNTVDNVSPVINTCEVFIAKNGAYVQLPTSYIYGDGDEVKSYSLSEKKLKVKLYFSDGGVGPASLEAKIEKVSDSLYLDKNFSFESITKPVDIHITGISAYACTIKDNQYLDECYIDLSDIPSDMESWFSVTFTAKDKKGQFTTTNKFYFVYDFTPPTQKLPLIYSGVNCATVRLSKNVNIFDEDLDTIQINDTILNSETTYLDVDCITKVRDYYTWSLNIPYSVTVTDYAGNSVTTKNSYRSTYEPEVGNSYFSDGTWSSSKTPVLQGKNPSGTRAPELIGIITNIPTGSNGQPDYSNVTVFHNQMLEGSYCLVPFTSKDKVKATQHNTSGGTVYDDGLTVKNYYKQFSDIYYSGTRVTKSNEKTDSLPSLYYYLDHVFTSPDDPNHLDWYLPSVSEFGGIDSSCLKAWVKNDSSVNRVPTCSTAATSYYNYTSMNLEKEEVKKGTDYYMFGDLVVHNPPDNYDCIISKVIPAAHVDLTKYY